MPATRRQRTAIQSSDVDATINIPLIADQLAVRAVIYDETARRVHR